MFFVCLYVFVFCFKEKIQIFFLCSEQYVFSINYFPAEKKPIFEAFRLINKRKRGIPKDISPSLCNRSCIAGNQMIEEKKLSKHVFI